MSRFENGQEIERFEERLREWGTRPPSLAAATAANRVLGLLSERRNPLPWLRFAAAGGVLVLIVIAAWVGAPRQPATPVAITSAAMESGDVVQFWLDAETPVYFVLPEFGQNKGESS